MSRKKPVAPVTTTTDITVNPTPRKRGRPPKAQPTLEVAPKVRTFAEETKT